MGKVVVSSFISLDGYIEASNREMIAPAPTPDLFRYFIEPALQRSGVLIYGRVTYGGMVGYWTSPAADPAEAARLAATRKVVFSRTLQRADWGVVEIARGDLVGVVSQLKRETDKDLIILGSAGLPAGTIAASSEAGRCKTIRQRLRVADPRAGSCLDLTRPGSPRKAHYPG
jgi:dihydrofolate reductase